MSWPLTVASGGARSLLLLRGSQMWSFEWGPGESGLLMAKLAALAEDERAPLDWVEASAVAAYIQGGGPKPACDRTDEGGMADRAGAAPQE